MTKRFTVESSRSVRLDWAGALLYSTRHASVGDRGLTPKIGALLLKKCLDAPPKDPAYACFTNALAANFLYFRNFSLKAIFISFGLPLKERLGDRFIFLQIVD